MAVFPRDRRHAHVATWPLKTRSCIGLIVGLRIPLSSTWVISGKQEDHNVFGMIVFVYDEQFD